MVNISSKISNNLKKNKPTLTKNYSLYPITTSLKPGPGVKDLDIISTGYEDKVYLDKEMNFVY
jgi:hypothetical protein